MSIVSIMRAASAAVALLGLAACFTEPTGDDDSGATTGDMCSMGALGCACYGNQTCDAGLACDSTIARCIPDGCTPGALSCTCDPSGECDAPFSCIEGICSSAGVPPATGDDTAGDTTVGVSSTGDTTTPPVTSSTTTASDDTTDVDDSGGVDCDVRATCADCIGCADEQPDQCADALTICGEITGCITIAQCLLECGLTSACFEPCCEGKTMPAIEQAFEVTQCRTDHCPMTCGPLEFPSVCPQP
jgi:hypothetical protein